MVTHKYCWLLCCGLGGLFCFGLLAPPSALAQMPQVIGAQASGEAQASGTQKPAAAGGSTTPGTPGRFPIDPKDPLKKPTPNDPNRYEWGGLPAVNYNTDSGIGIGLIGTLVKFRPGYDPYFWRLFAVFFVNVLQEPGRKGGIGVPYQAHYILFDLPGLAKGRLRLTFQALFTQYSLSVWTGPGNNSGFDPRLQRSRYYFYDRINPTIDVGLRWSIYRKGRTTFDFKFKVAALYNWINPFDDGKPSRLKDDAAGRNGPYLQSFMVGLAPHGHIQGTAGLLWDSRNHEVAPSRGFFHELDFRFGKGLGLGFAYGGLQLTSRAFFSLWKEYLVLAGRIQGDIVFGIVPFYDLFRFGGAKSIRGIPYQRYHGNVMVLANIELRSKFLFFSVGKNRFQIGAIAFLDAGRVWAGFTKQPALDGRGLGLKVSGGGGLRIQWGETFVVRADFAYSPTERTNGIYVDIGHIF